MSFSQEWNNSATGVTTWPNGISGEVRRGSPRILAVNMTSTLGASMVNEARFGLRYNKRDSIQPINTQEGKDADLTAFLLDTGRIPDSPVVRARRARFSSLREPAESVLTASEEATSFSTPRPTVFWQCHHALHFWRHVKLDPGHSLFKFGGEYRPTKSKGYGTPQPFISASGPSSTAPQNPSPLAAGTTGDLAAFTTAGTLSLVRTNASNLLYTLAGNLRVS